MKRNPIPAPELSAKWWQFLKKRRHREILRIVDEINGETNECTGIDPRETMCLKNVKFNKKGQPILKTK